MGIIRQTLAVKLLLSEFEKESSAISAIELIKRLGSQVNKTTIYRLLDKLEDDGLLHYFLDAKGANALCIIRPINPMLFGFRSSSVKTWL